MLANSLVYRQTVEHVRHTLQKYEEVFSVVPAQIDGGRFCRELLAQIDSMLMGVREAPVTLQRAAESSGYSADHLRRLIREGLLPTYREGRKHLVLLSEVPVRVHGARSAKHNAASGPVLPDTSTTETVGSEYALTTASPSEASRPTLAPAAIPSYDPIADARSVLARVRGAKD